MTKLISCMTANMDMPIGVFYSQNYINSILMQYRCSFLMTKMMTMRIL